MSGCTPTRCFRSSFWPSRYTAGGIGGAAYAKKARSAWFVYRLEEAGRILGASRMRTLRDITAPLLGPSLVATWWQTRKHTANWWLWIAVDLVYIGEYLYKGLRPTAVLYALLVALAVLGLRSWQRANSEASIERPGAPGIVD